jgi:hypothetical protein
MIPLTPKVRIKFIVMQPVELWLQNKKLFKDIRLQKQEKDLVKNAVVLVDAIR